MARACQLSRTLRLSVDSLLVTSLHACRTGLHRPCLGAQLGMLRRRRRAFRRPAGLAAPAACRPADIRRPAGRMCAGESGVLVERIRLAGYPPPQPAKTPSPRVTCCSPCSNQLQKLRRESLHSWEQPSSRVSNNRVYASTPASQGGVAPTKNAVAAWAGVRPEATAEYVALQPPESVPRGEHLEALLRPNLVPAKRGLRASAVAEVMSQLASVRL